MAQKRPILKLNANFFPIGTDSWQDIMTGIFSGAFHPLDIVYSEQEGESFNAASVEYFNIVNTYNDWLQLPIREYDDFVHSAKGPIRLPSVVVCANYDKVRFKQVVFPSKQNIFKRDNYTCGYSGKKLQKHELSVDHILPVSRGGQNTWENLITCDRELNTFKDNRLPQECGLKLLWAPKKPSNGVVIDVIRDEWAMFLGKQNN